MGPPAQPVADAAPAVSNRPHVTPAPGVLVDDSLMRVRIALIAFVALAAASWPRAAAACVCATGSSGPCQDYRDAATVFVGDVLASEPIDGAVRYRVEVERSLKGSETGTTEVWSDTSSCGVQLVQGDRYVFYGRGPGPLHVFTCSPLVHLARGEPAPELPPVPGRLYGRVVRFDMKHYRATGAFDAVPSVRVWIDLPAGRVDTLSDAWGLFTLADIPPGEHELGVDAGPGLVADGHDVSVGPRSRDACEAPLVRLYPSGGLSGRIVTSSGRPAGEIDFDLFRAGEAGSPGAECDYVETDAHGRFEVDGLEPGEYVLAINLDGASTRQPYPPAFLGGKDAASATRLGVGANGTLELSEPWVLPRALPTRLVPYRVVCRDGTVPSYVHAYAEAQGRDYRSEPPLGNEEGGQDTLRLFRDRAYTLHVTATIAVGPRTGKTRPQRTDELTPVEIPPGGPARTMTVTVPATDCANPE